MRILLVSVWILLSLLLSSCGQKIEKNDASDIYESDVVEVIDFYGTHRCETCLTIESRTKKVLEDYYSDELQKGKITFKAVNVDDAENFELAEMFEATGSALFIHIIKDGSSEIIDLTEFAFMNAMDESDAFELGLIKQMRDALMKM